MRILLDTHIFLWFISGDSQLSTDVRDAIRVGEASSKKLKLQLAQGLDRSPFFSPVV